METRKTSNKDTNGGETEDAEQKNDEQLEILQDVKYGAEHVMQIFAPVTICMSFVALVMSVMDHYKSADFFLPYTPFHTETEDTAIIVFENLMNTFIILGIVIGLTSLLALLYYLRFYRALYAWLFFAGLAMLFYLQVRFVRSVFQELEAPVDMITCTIFIINVAILGILVIYWYGPLRVQQVYLVVMAGLLALFLVKHIPDWTAWFLLAFISLWDLVAVLHPRGPLRMLVNLAKERNESVVPVLIYSCDKEKVKKKDESQGDDKSSGERVKKSKKVDKASAQSNNAEEEDDGIKLGLGDFIFYSILVAKTCVHYNGLTVVASIISILVGLQITLILLALYRAALPALPISIFLALATCFMVAFMGAPMADSLAMKQVFV